jgi:hypothetical protein
MIMVQVTLRMVRHLKLYAGSDLAETSLAGGWHSRCSALNTQEI